MEKTLRPYQEKWLRDACRIQTTENQRHMPLRIWKDVTGFSIAKVNQIIRKIYPAWFVETYGGIDPIQIEFEQCTRMWAARVQIDFVRHIAPLPNWTKFPQAQAARLEKWESLDRFRYISKPYYAGDPHEARVRGLLILLAWYHWRLKSEAPTQFDKDQFDAILERVLAIYDADDEGRDPYVANEDYLHQMGEIENPRWWTNPERMNSL